MKFKMFIFEGCSCARTSLGARVFRIFLVEVQECSGEFGVHPVFWTAAGPWQERLHFLAQSFSSISDEFVFLIPKKRVSKANLCKILLLPGPSRSNSDPTL